MLVEATADTSLEFRVAIHLLQKRQADVLMELIKTLADRDPLVTPRRRKAGMICCEFVSLVEDGERSAPIVTSKRPMGQI